MAKYTRKRELQDKGQGRRSSRKRSSAHQQDMGITHISCEAEDATPAFQRRDDRPFVAKTKRQADYRNSIMHNTLTFGVGPLGTGKTYVSVVAACDLFIGKRIERMIFTRPALGAEEELGFFKGDLDEKMAPWVKPIREVLDRKLGKSYVDYLISRQVISFEPLATMRGHSWPNTFMMLDEAQNTTPNQMKLFLGRAGENTILVVDGDYAEQKDIEGKSGLSDALEVLEGCESVGVVEFQPEDIVRSGFVRMMIMAYRRRDAKK